MGCTRSLWLRPKGPRSEQFVLLLVAELEDLGEADEEVHGYLSALARYDVFEEDRVVSGFLGQLGQAHTVLGEDAKWRMLELVQLSSLPAPSTPGQAALDSSTGMIGQPTGHAPREVGFSGAVVLI
jgi:hypothetical protein